jgi:hypothetical protein
MMNFCRTGILCLRAQFPVPGFAGCVLLAEEFRHVLNKADDNHNGRTYKPNHEHPDEKMFEKFQGKHAASLLPVQKKRS